MESKEYIGHGKKHSEYSIIDVVLDLDKALEFAYDYEGKRYLKFSVAERKSPNEYGKTHTAYIRPKKVDATEGTAAVASEPKPKRRTRKAKA